MSCHYLLTVKAVLRNKLRALWCFLCMQLVFLLLPSKLFTIFNFCHFNHRYYCGSLWSYFVWCGVLCASWVWMCVFFPSLRMFSAIIFSNKVFVPFSLSSPSEIPMRMFLHFILVPGTIPSISIFFSFCSSCLISYSRYSRSLIHSSA